MFALVAIESGILCVIVLVRVRGAESTVSDVRPREYGSWRACILARAHRGETAGFDMGGMGTEKVAVSLVARNHPA